MTALLFSQRPCIQFQQEETRRFGVGTGRPLLDESQLRIKSSRIPFLAAKVKITIPFTGNPKWFSVYDEETPFSALFAGETPKYSISYDQDNQPHLKVTIAASSEQQRGTAGPKSRADEFVKALNDYIMILCGPPMPSLAELVKLAEADG